VKELVEWDVVTPVLVVLKILVVAKHGSTAARRLIADEDSCQASGKLVRNLSERQETTRARRALDGERIAVVPSGCCDRLDQQEIHRKPDRASPVRVPPNMRLLESPGRYATSWTKSCPKRWTIGS
jgi:hypothetical protein